MWFIRHVDWQIWSVNQLFLAQKVSADRQHCVCGAIKHLFFQMKSDFRLGISNPHVLLRQTLTEVWVPPSTSEAVISWNKEATEAKLSNIRCWKMRSISKLHKPCWTIYCRTLSTLYTSRLTLQNRWWWSLNTSGSQLLKQIRARSNASS